MIGIDWAWSGWFDRQWELPSSPITHFSQTNPDHMPKTQALPNRYSTIGDPHSQPLGTFRFARRQWGLLRSTSLLMHCHEWTSHVSVHAYLKVPIHDSCTTYTTTSISSRSFRSTYNPNAIPTRPTRRTKDLYTISTRADRPFRTGIQDDS